MPDKNWWAILPKENGISKHSAIKRGIICYPKNSITTENSRDAKRRKKSFSGEQLLVVNFTATKTFETDIPVITIRGDAMQNKYVFHLLIYCFFLPFKGTSRLSFFQDFFYICEKLAQAPASLRLIATKTMFETPVMH